MKGEATTAYKDEKRGTWFANFRYKDWRGVPQRRSKRGPRTRREAEAWERDFKKRVSKAASMEFGFACDLYLQDTEPRVRETTLEGNVQFFAHFDSRIASR